MIIALDKYADLKAKATDYAKTCKDVIVNNREYIADYVLGTALGGGKERVSDNAYRQILAHHGIPCGFASKLEKLGLGSTTLMNTISDISKEIPDTPRMIRYTTDKDGNPIARAFLSNSYERLDNMEVIEAIEDSKLGDFGLTMKSANITDDYLQMSFVSEKLTESVTVGDELQFGVSIHNSEVGLSSFRIVPFVYRLVCSNGMVAASSDGLGVYRRFHIGKKQELGELLPACEVATEERRLSPKVIREKVAELLSQDKIEKIMAQIKEKAEQIIDAPTIQIVANLRKEIVLTDKEADLIASHIDESDVAGPTSVYSVMNAVTKAAHTAKDYDRNIELQQLGWRILHNTSAKTYERPVKIAA